jgi:hypothetical protein
VKLTTNIIPILTSAGLTLSSHPLLAMNQLHKSLLITSLADNITQDLLDDSVRTAAKSTTGLSTLLPNGHPIRGVALAELGKLLAVDEPAPPAPSLKTTFPPSGPPRLKLAYETLVKAREELMVGFGNANGGGQVGGDVRETIVGLEKELGVWKQGVRNVIDDTPKSKVS